MREHDHAHLTHILHHTHTHILLTHTHQNLSAVLYDRLYKAQRSKSTPTPKFPFSPVDILPPQPATQTSSVNQTQLTPSEPQPTSLYGNTGITGLTGQGDVNPYGRTSHSGSTSFVGQIFTPASSSAVTQPLVPQPIFQPHPPGTFIPAPVGRASSQAPPTKREPDPYNTDTAASWNDPPVLKSKVGVALRYCLIVSVSVLYPMSTCSPSPHLLEEVLLQSLLQSWLQYLSQSSPSHNIHKPHLLHRTTLLLYNHLHRRLLFTKQDNTHTPSGAVLTVCVCDLIMAMNQESNASTCLFVCVTLLWP